MGFLGFGTKGGIEATTKLVDTGTTALRKIRNTFAKNLTPDEQAALDQTIAELEAAKFAAEQSLALALANAGHVVAAVIIGGYRPVLFWGMSICLIIQLGVLPILAALGIIGPYEADLAPVVA